MSQSYNWLVSRLHEQALETMVLRYAKGRLVDIGCGEKPYRTLTTGRVTSHLGLDHPGSPHDHTHIDIFGTAYETGLREGACDTVLCTVVLEHLERPQDALHEMCRILKPGGHLILSAPLFWHLHEEPRDFYRYTRHGLTHLLTTAGFEVVDLQPLSGFIVTFAQESVYFLNRLRRGPSRYPIALVQWLLQALAYAFHPWDRSYQFTWAYLVVGRKL